MKKIIAVMLAVLTVCSMAACGKKQEPQTDEQGSPIEVQVETAELSTEGGKDAVAVAQKVMDAKNAYQYSGVLALGHEKYVKNMAARMRMDVEELLCMYDELAAGIQYETEKDKGEHTLTGKVGEATAVDGEELTALQERYEDLYELTVTRAAEVPLTITAEYESGKEESEETVVIVEIDDRWYLELGSVKLV